MCSVLYYIHLKQKEINFSNIFSITRVNWLKTIVLEYCNFFWTVKIDIVLNCVLYIFFIKFEKIRCQAIKFAKNHMDSCKIDDEIIWYLRFFYLCLFYLFIYLCFHLILDIINLNIFLSSKYLVEIIYEKSNYLYLYFYLYYLIIQFHLFQKQSSLVYLCI